MTIVTHLKPERTRQPSCLVRACDFSSAALKSGSKKRRGTHPLTKLGRGGGGAVTSGRTGKAKTAKRRTAAEDAPTERRKAEKAAEDTQTWKAEKQPARG